MNEASSLSVSVSAGSNGKRGSVSRMLTLERVIEWINHQKLDEFTTNGLVALASKYPDNALPLFKKNFNLMLQRVRATRQKEGDVRNEVIEQETRKEETAPSFEDALNSDWDKPQKTSIKEALSQTEIDFETSLEEDFTQESFQEDPNNAS